MRLTFRQKRIMLLLFSLIIISRTLSPPAPNLKKNDQISSYRVTLDTAGMSPETIEQELAIPLEQCIANKISLVEITSISMENSCTLSFKLKGERAHADFLEIRKELLQKTSALPPNISRPQITGDRKAQKADMLLVTTDLTLEERICRIEGVASVTGTRELETAIQLRLRRDQHKYPESPIMLQKTLSEWNFEKKCGIIGYGVAKQEVIFSSSIWDRNRGLSPLQTLYGNGLDVGVHSSSGFPIRLNEKKADLLTIRFDQTAIPSRTHRKIMNELTGTRSAGELLYSRQESQNATGMLGLRILAIPFTLLLMTLFHRPAALRTETEYRFLFSFFIATALCCSIKSPFEQIHPLCAAILIGTTSLPWHLLKRKSIAIYLTSGVIYLLFSLIMQASFASGLLVILYLPLCGALAKHCLPAEFKSPLPTNSSSLLLTALCLTVIAVSSMVQGRQNEWKKIEVRFPRGITKEEVKIRTIQLEKSFRERMSSGGSLISVADDHKSDFYLQASLEQTQSCIQKINSYSIGHAILCADLVKTGNSWLLSHPRREQLEPALKSVAAIADEKQISLLTSRIPEQALVIAEHPSWISFPAFRTLPETEFLKYYSKPVLNRTVVNNRVCDIQLTPPSGISHRKSYPVVTGNISEETVPAVLMRFNGLPTERVLFPNEMISPNGSDVRKVLAEIPGLDIKSDNQLTAYKKFPVTGLVLLFAPLLFLAEILRRRKNETNCYPE